MIHLVRATLEISFNGRTADFECEIDLETDPDGATQLYDIRVERTHNNDSYDITECICELYSSLDMSRLIRSLEPS